MGTGESCIVQMDCQCGLPVLDDATRSFVRRVLGGLVELDDLKKADEFFCCSAYDVYFAPEVRVLDGID